MTPSSSGGDSRFPDVCVGCIALAKVPGHPPATGLSAASARVCGRLGNSCSTPGRSMVGEEFRMSIQRALAVLLVLAAPSAAFAQAGYADTSLGGGYVVIPPGNLATNWIGGQSTGKIVIVGRLNVTVPGTSDITIGAERIGTDGTFDTTFGQNGLFSFATPYNPFGAIAAAVQADDCIVTLSSEFEIVRINANGTLDANFGSGGMVDMWGTYKRNWNAGSVAIQPDGKIVVAGFSSPQTGHSTTGWDLTILRLNVNGSLDPTFGNFGHGSTPGFIVDAVTGNQQFNRRCLAIQPDGKLVVVCWGTDSPSFVARYLSTGALDTTFGVGGRRTFSITGNDVPTGLALMGDGRIVVGGHGQNGTTAFVVRFSAGGVLDTSFGAGGSTTRNFGAGTG